jgi:hypothetical protein
MATRQPLRTIYSHITKGYSPQFARYCNVVALHHIGQRTFLPNEYHHVAWLRNSISASFQQPEEILGLLAGLAGLTFDTTRLKLVKGLLHQYEYINLGMFDDDWIEAHDFIVRLVIRVDSRVYLHIELLIKVLT